ncbi:MAG TPA: hypothetical protein VLH75_01330 [Longimicrobiales bacterium]|nr:hypothetical protein [Longimicrobiales bacterium]
MSVELVQEARGGLVHDGAGAVEGGLGLVQEPQAEEELHALGVAALVERAHVQRAAEPGQGLGIVAGGAERGRPGGEGVSQLALPAGSDAVGPVVEGGGVGQGEVGEGAAVPEAVCGLDVTRGEGGLEFVQVRADDSGLQRQTAIALHDGLGAHRLAHHVERLAHGGPGAFGLGGGPEIGDQVVARDAVRLQGQQAQERERLAGGEDGGGSRGSTGMRVRTSWTRGRQTKL